MYYTQHKWRGKLTNLSRGGVSVREKSPVMGDGASYFFIRLEVNLFVNICTQTRRRLCHSHESEELVFYAHVINAHSYSGIFTPHSLAIHCGVVRYYVATGKLHCIVTKECQYSSTMKVVLTWCHSINSQLTDHTERASGLSSSRLWFSDEVYDKVDCWFYSQALHSRMWAARITCT